MVTQDRFASNWSSNAKAKFIQKHISQHLYNYKQVLATSQTCLYLLVLPNSWSPYFARAAQSLRFNSQGIYIYTPYTYSDKIKFNY